MGSSLRGRQGSREGGYWKMWRLSINKDQGFEVAYGAYLQDLWLMIMTLRDNVSPLESTTWIKPVCPEHISVDQVIDRMKPVHGT